MGSNVMNSLDETSFWFPMYMNLNICQQRFPFFVSFYGPLSIKVLGDRRKVAIWYIALVPSPYYGNMGCQVSKKKINIFQKKLYLINI